MSDIKIQKIVLNIGKKELLLSLEQARELKAALEELFQPKEVHHWHTREVIKDKYPYSYPYYQPIWYSQNTTVDMTPKISMTALGE